MQRACEFLAKCDLSLGQIGFREAIYFTYSGEDKPISYFKGLLEQAYNTCENTILKIEGGIVE